MGRELEYNKYYYDYLTNLPNRYFLYEYYNHDNNKFIFVLFYFDNLTYINDSYGHLFGDKVSVEISKALIEIVKDNGKIFRFGGDEFIVIFHRNLDEAISIVEDVTKKFNYFFKVEGKDILTTVSAGIYAPKIGEHMDDIIRKANTAMLKAKKLGKSKYVIFDKTMEDDIVKKTGMIVDIKKAILNNEFYLLFQPIYNLRENRIKEVEALARWRNNKYGGIPPSRFIPVIEETGLIKEFGVLIIEDVFKQINDWRNKGIVLKVNINVSPLQLRDDDFLFEFDQLISKYKIPLNLVEIEFTETQILDINQQEIKKINELLRRGIRISLDDFGVGYSSLINMIEFPISTIKMDKSLIDRIDEKKVRTLIKGILHISKEMNYEVVAEGVETKEQLSMLKEWGCDKIQGYYISKPKAPREIELMFKNMYDKYNVILGSTLENYVENR
ncbi:putative bifunctional diguanylate cyclase/phosphodiesterase [Thermoanaerobacterium thermosaccharolyticum]|uniref:putative bifunctional diguanylate cyclase/phosphodiesterase n=1 Tax=Thermoanaerobacterium thermosaccharolyticum TaxID=1517 RepID=UPI0020A3522C|nr:bifunctional diguanylate cyclase/phosphodiesterase [Thermoanaerobacterium thermosaccharolyticum]MCP2238985.1 diguanylate cyclase (GGDEF)-like protein [Thermoanaerobacterium thermosaccharolyticum]